MHFRAAKKSEVDRPNVSAVDLHLFSHLFCGTGGTGGTGVASSSGGACLCWCKCCWGGVLVGVVAVVRGVCAHELAGIRIWMSADVTLGGSFILYIDIVVQGELTQIAKLQ